MRHARPGRFLMKKKAILSSAVSVLIGLALVVGLGWGDEERDASRKPPSESDRQIARHAQRMLEEGRRIFRFDTFGSEAFFGDALQLHKAIAGANPAVFRARDRLVQLQGIAG